MSNISGLVKEMTIAELKALAEDRDLKKGLFEIELRSLRRLRERQVMFIGTDEGRLYPLPHLRQLYKRMCADLNLFRRRR